MRKAAYCLISTLVVFFSVNCSLMSSLGKAMLSDSQEEEIGAEFHAQLKQNTSEYPVLKEDTPQKKALAKYVNGVFEDVLKAVPRSDRPDYKKKFTFTIIDKNVENAFAVPGGYIYVYTGILKTMQNESELAGVLCHEIAHVTKHHYRNYAVKATIINQVMDAVLGGEGTLSVFVKKSFNVLSGSYLSRDNEAEADEYGTKYLAASKRNPLGISEYFNRQKDHSMVFMSSHPNPSQRVEAVNKLVKAHPKWNKLKGNTYESRFKTAISYL